MCWLTVQMDLTGSAGPDLSQEPGAPCGSTTYRRGSWELQLLSHAVPCPPRCWVRSRAERFTPAPQAAACLPGLQCQHWRTFLHCDFYCVFFFFEFWSLLSGMLIGPILDHLRLCCYIAFIFPLNIFSLFTLKFVFSTLFPLKHHTLYFSFLYFLNFSLPGISFYL